MQIVVPRETARGEKRVAVTPDVVPQLTRTGHTVTVENCAGEGAGFSNSEYEHAGATVAGAIHDAARRADAVLTILRPPAQLLQEMRRGSILIGLLQPATDPSFFRSAAELGITTLAMEMVPRTTRAQMMDALSSQSTVAGYKAVLLAASALPKFFPMLMTAAGTVRPARVLVIGAGVAGLQAIATARRIGAVVEAFDTRPVVKEQVQSLGASFVELDVHPEEAQDAGGYAKELKEEHIKREMELIQDRAKHADVIITTALVPGKRAPLLVTAETVRAMKPGSVIVDLAGEQGGNCELSAPGETVMHHGVRILAPLHISSELAFQASQMYAKNIVSLVDLIAPKGELKVDFADDIIDSVCITHAGEIRHRGIREKLGIGMEVGA